jgi:hypothetical protein
MKICFEKKTVIRYVQKYLLNNCEFHENQLSENHTLLRGDSDILFPYLPQVLSDFGEIQYTKSSYNSFENF